MSTEVTAEIEKANTAFYRALESGAIERMDEVWAHEDRVRCIHPGWGLVAGWHRVRESWEMIFSGGQKMRVSATDVSVQSAGEFAWVTCTENITVFGEMAFDSAQAVATNLFVRQADRWLMILHHASPIPMIVADNSSDIIQ
jgi:ketosteroid isomerase-like protein